MDDITTLVEAWLAWEATPSSRESHDRVVTLQAAVAAVVPAETRSRLYDAVAEHRRLAINAGRGRSLEAMFREAMREVLT